MSDLKITQKQLDLIPTVVNILKENIESAEKEIKQQEEIKSFLENKIDVPFDYASVLLREVLDDINQTKGKLNKYKKQLDCNHNVEDLMWVGDGHDSHYDYYTCMCKNCNLEIDDYRH